MPRITLTLKELHEIFEFSGLYYIEDNQIKIDEEDEDTLMFIRQRDEGYSVTDEDTGEVTRYKTLLSFDDDDGVIPIGEKIDDI